MWKEPSQRLTGRPSGCSIALIVVVLVVAGLWAMAAFGEHQWKMERVPGYLKPIGIEWSRVKTDQLPFIASGGWQNLALIVYRMDSAEAEALKREGLPRLMAQARAEMAGVDEHFIQGFWRPTPAIPVDMRIRQEDEPPLPPLPETPITVRGYLFDWTGEPWPPRIESLVDGLLASPGNFWSGTGLTHTIVVSPETATIAYLYYSP